MSSDALYGSCIDETLKLYSRHESGQMSTYMYLFDYLGQNSMVNLITNNSPRLFNTGVCHGDELFYLFSLNSDDVKSFSTYDHRISQRLARLWTDFAKYGSVYYLNNLNNSYICIFKIIYNLLIIIVFTLYTFFTCLVFV